MFERNKNKQYLPTPVHYSAPKQSLTQSLSLGDLENSLEIHVIEPTDDGDSKIPRQISADNMYKNMLESSLKKTKSSETGAAMPINSRVSRFCSTRFFVGYFTFNF
jgi:hypothetical protein